MPDYTALLQQMLAAVRHLRTATRRWERAKQTGAFASSPYSVRKLKTARIELEAAIERVKRIADRL